MIAMVIVVLRFGSRMIRTQMITATGSSGISSSLRLAFSLRRAASTCAPHTHNATLTSSEGCTDSPAMLNHRRAPLLSMPICGIRTSTSRIVVTVIITAANLRNTRTGNHRVTANTATPMTANTSCVVNRP